MPARNQYNKYDSYGDLNPLWIQRQLEIQDLEDQVENQKYIDEQFGTTLKEDCEEIRRKYKAMELGTLGAKMDFITKCFNEGPASLKMCCMILGLDYNEVLEAFNSDDECHMLL